MDIDFIRAVCRKLPHTTEQVQWGSNLVFKVSGKMYAVADLEPSDVCLSFKCSPEDFAALTECPGIIPAPYLARAQWVALESEDALPAAEIKRCLKQAHGLVFAKLPKKVLAELTTGERPCPRRLSSR